MVEETTVFQNGLTCHIYTADLLAASCIEEVVEDPTAIGGGEITGIYQ
jgi:hypothetical protein